MKHSKFYFVTLLLLAAGCQQITEEDFLQDEFATDIPQRIITAYLEGHDETRTELSGPDADGIYYPYWSEGDEVAVWADGINVTDKYKLADGSGTGKASFKGTLSGSRMVGLYPYSDKTQEGLDGDVLTLELPSTQSYLAGSFGQGAYPMLAVSESDSFTFKNLCAVLKLSLTGEEAVNEILFRAHDSGMPVSGKATVRTDFDKDPELVMSAGGSPEVTLSCGFVPLDKTVPTDFFIVVPAGTYKGGFTVEIKTFTGTVTKSTSADITFQRSQLRAIPAFECIGTGEIDIDNIPYNQIWYADLYNRVFSFSSSQFDVPVVSVKYENGWGVITFEGPVTEVGRNTFSNSYLTDVILPNCVETIRRGAFTNSGIQSFRTPDALKTVEDQAFRGNQLTRIYGKWASEDEKAIVMPDGMMVAYANGAMEGSLIVPDGVKSLQDYLFFGNQSVREVILPSGIESLGAYCFYDSTLERITLPESLQRVGSLAFAYCSQLAEFKGGSPLNLDGRALVSNGNMIAYAGKGMADYVIPEGVTEISRYVFVDWEDLRSLTFPSTLSNLYSGFLSNCPNLEFFYGEGASADHHCLVLYGEYLVAATAICPADYRVPDGVQRIFQGVFQGNASIERLTMPDEVYFIHYYAFADMPNLRSLTLSSGLTQLAGDCFRGSNALEELYLRPYSPPSYSESDGDLAKWGADNLVIYVPEGYQEQYKSTSPWSKYADRIQGYVYDDLEKPDYYISTDYSQDGEVTVLQQASDGNGIDLVLMGDAFTDRQIADGTYDEVMRKMADAFFSEEPYASFRHLFNVRSVKAVSSTEGYEHGGQALAGWFGDGTSVGGNDSKCMEYARKAVSSEQMDQTLIIVAMNSTRYAGTCYMYYPSGGDYGNGLSIAYFPIGETDEGLAQVVHHEAGGHGFAKLADEYAYENMGTIPQSEIDNRNATVPYGWWRNCDFTDDPELVKWSHFLADSRYRFDGLGLFEGGFTYWKGVWRPTENSIMRYNTDGFNAPSREAIWYRIHKLAYGDDWEYDYEEFVAYDALNRKTSSYSASRGNTVERHAKPTSPPVVIPRRWDEPAREPSGMVRGTR